MSHLRHLRHATPILIATSMLMLTACADDNGIDGPIRMQLWDIVTYEGPASGSKGSVFTFRQVDDTPLVTLTADETIEETEAGTRIMIRYIPENGEAYRSDHIDLLTASRINQGPATTEWKSDYDNWNRDSVWVYSAWRSGTYINFHLRLTYSNEPRIFTLALDPATRESEMPEFYLVHRMKEPVDYHDRAYFASFDIAEVWNLPSARGVKIHLADTNLHKDIFTFYKSN